MTEIFERQVRLPVSAAEGFSWHERPGALDRLIPPWEKVSISRRGDGIRDGSIVELKQRLGPFALKWKVRHFNYRPGESFCDTQVSGPFSHWKHLHRFEESGDGRGDLLVDRIEYQMPGGKLGKWLAAGLVRKKLRAMFEYRHTTTRDDLDAHGRHESRQRLLIAVTGASGLVGSQLVPMLTTGGHSVIKLSRQASSAQGDVRWNAFDTHFDASPLAGIDALVHLAGENVAAVRWTNERKRKIRESRVQGTRVLCEALAGMEHPPKTLICASATGYYGDRGNELLNEQSSAGTGFLAEVAKEWEQATEAAERAGIRVVHVRFGMILTPRGGALQKMLRPFQLGLGGSIGNGGQYWSWISIDDAIGAIHHCLFDDRLTGAVNGVAPSPVTCRQFAQTLARVLGRPAIIALPRRLVRTAFGEMAEEILLASTRVMPDELLDSDYVFRHDNLEQSLRHLLGKPKK